MKGSMRERRPGYWQLRVFEGADPLTGKKQYRTQSFRGTKRQAQSALASLVSQVNGGVIQTRTCTVTELIDAWLAHIENVGRSPSTLYNYRRLVRQLPDGFKALPLSKVTPKVVDDLYRFLAKGDGAQAGHGAAVPRSTARRLRPGREVGVDRAQPDRPGDAVERATRRTGAAGSRRRVAGPRTGCAVEELGPCADLPAVGGYGVPARRGLRAQVVGCSVGRRETSSRHSAGRA